MSQFAQYTPPEVTEGDRYKPIDYIGHVLVVKVNEHKTGIVTSNSPDGGPGVIVDVLDLDAAAGSQSVFRDVLWMGGAMVDGLKNYVGKLVVIKLEAKKSKSGRSYPSPADAASDVPRAEKYIAQNGDPFAPKVSSIGGNEPPF